MPVYTYTTIDDPSAVTGSTVAGGINDADQIVGNYQDAGGLHGYLLSGGIFTTLNDALGVKGTFATGINDTGQIVGSYIDAGGHRHGFIDNGGTYTNVDYPGSTDTFVQGINASGLIVGTYTDATSGHHGFIQSGPVFTALDDPSATPGNTIARGINASGIVVGIFVNAMGEHGFIYNPNNHTYTTLDDPLGGTTDATGSKMRARPLAPTRPAVVCIPSSTVAVSTPP